MRWVFVSIFIWLTFVMSLAGWWLYFGVTTLARAATVDIPSQLARHQKMLFTEGAVLLFALLSGGIALFYFSFRMYREKIAKEIFFASFTHDMKTALFRLQLQLEQEPDGLNKDKLLGQTRQMQLQLENGLDSSVGQNKKLYIESLDFKNFVSDLHAQWPELSFQLKGDANVRADKKALHSVFKNLLHNSFLHGQADQVAIQLSGQKGKSQIHYSDNGKTFEGQLTELGASPSHDGSSGFGLYILKQWIQRMGGHVQFLRGPSGALEVSIQLPGGSE